MEEDVVVLSDAEGNLFTLTPELIRMAKVRSDEHRELVTRLASAAGEQDLLPGFSIFGKYKRSDDPRIQKKFVEPQAVRVEVNSVADP